MTSNSLSSLERDHGNDGVDQVITYTLDSNDRLIDEVLDDLTAADTTTTYTDDHTQNTSKPSAALNFPLSTLLLLPSRPLQRGCQRRLRPGWWTPVSVGLIESSAERQMQKAKP